jgi:hypothetical protein
MLWRREKPQIPEKAQEPPFRQSIVDPLKFA